MDFANPLYILAPQFNYLGDQFCPTKVIYQGTRKSASTLKAPNKNCSRRHFNFYFKIRHDVSSESSARQRIHLKHQVLFSLKTIKKYLWMSSAAVVIGALRVICKATHGLCSKLRILDRGIPLGAVEKPKSEKKVLTPLQTPRKISWRISVN